MPQLGIEPLPCACEASVLFFFVKCVPVCVYRLHSKFYRLDSALLRIISLRIHFLTFISCFVIDLLSICD